MRKLKVENGNVTKSIIAMPFICKALEYSPINFLNTAHEKIQPSWTGFTVCMLIAVGIYVLFSLFTKEEGTTINGRKVDLNGINIVTKQNGDGSVSYEVSGLNVDKGVSSEAGSIIDAFRSIPNVSSVSSKPRK